MAVLPGITFGLSWGKLIISLNTVSWIYVTDGQWISSMLLWSPIWLQSFLCSRSPLWVPPTKDIVRKVCGLQRFLIMQSPSRLCSPGILAPAVAVWLMAGPACAKTRPESKRAQVLSSKLSFAQLKMGFHFRKCRYKFMMPHSFFHSVVNIFFQTDLVEYQTRRPI